MLNPKAFREDDIRITEVEEQWYVEKRKEVREVVNPFLVVNASSNKQIP